MSDHSGFAADLPRAFLALRAKPDPARRAAALMTIEGRLGAAISGLEAGKRRRSWIPLYGAFLSARYDRQLARLTALRERVISARL